MKLFFFTLLFASSVLAQSFQVTIINEETKQPIPLVTVGIVGTTIGAVSDSNGNAYFPSVPAGEHTLRFSCIGYTTVEKAYRFPHLTDEIPYITLEPEEVELDEVVISSTRGSRLLKDEPNRVETISGEEIDEKISMESSNISMMLSEMPGIEVRTGSAFTGSTGFVIQGLDGKYTMLLRDGFPEYSGYSGSLSLQQIAPVDIKQIEVIKGSSSTLYGGGAIGGLVNLISKTPTAQGEQSILLNATSAGGYDLSGFAGKQFGTIGGTFVFSVNSQKAYDGNNDKYADLPKEKRISLVPRFFYEGETVKGNLGVRYINEKRTGGYMPLIENKNTPVTTLDFMQETSSERVAINGEAEMPVANGLIRLRGGYYTYTEDGDANPLSVVTIPELLLVQYNYKTKAVTSFSDLVYSTKNFIAGASWQSELFEYNINPSVNSTSSTTGLFSQYTFTLSENLIIEPGLRLDISGHHSPQWLPRLVAMIKPESNMTVRLSYGTGYRHPAALSDETEGLAMQHIDGTRLHTLEFEKSTGFQGDFTYRYASGSGFGFQVNQLFFYNSIANAVYLEQVNFYDSRYYYRPFSSGGTRKTAGFETTTQISFGPVTLHGVYTLTTINESIDRSTIVDFAYDIKHRAGFNLIYEKDGLKAGYELYLSGEQEYADAELGAKPGFAIHGFFAEKNLGAVSIFVNCENLFDMKQNAPRISPPFSPAYQYAKPTDGRVINGGVKIRL